MTSNNEYTSLRDKVVVKAQNKQSFTPKEYKFIYEFIKTHDKCAVTSENHSSLNSDDSGSEKNSKDKDISHTSQRVIGMCDKKLGADYNVLEIHKKMPKTKSDSAWDRLLDLPDNIGKRKVDNDGADKNNTFSKTKKLKKQDDDDESSTASLSDTCEKEKKKPEIGEANGGSNHSEDPKQQLGKKKSRKSRINSPVNNKVEKISKNLSDASEDEADEDSKKKRRSTKSRQSLKSEKKKDSEKLSDMSGDESEIKESTKPKQSLKTGRGSRKSLNLSENESDKEIGQKRKSAKSTQSNKGETSDSAGKEKPKKRGRPKSITGNKKNNKSLLDDDDNASKDKRIKSLKNEEANFSDSSENSTKLNAQKEQVDKICDELLESDNEDYDKPESIEKYKKQFTVRRNFITQEENPPTVEQIKVKYPYMFNKDKVFLEFELITGTDDLLALFKRNVDLYSDYLMKNVTSTLKKKVDPLMEKADEETKKYLLQASSLLLLPKYLGDNRKSMIVFDYQQPPEDHDNRPYIKCEGDVEFSLNQISSFCIIVEDIELCKVTSIIEAYLALLAAYYIFNAVYPESCENTFYLLEKLYINYSDTSTHLEPRINKLIKALVKSPKK